VPLDNRSDGRVVVKDAPGKARRSLYVLARRNYHPSLLSVFDQPVLATNCTCRNPSAVVLQSLTMLNDAFVLEQADALARRLIARAEKPQQRIDLAFQMVLIRRPTSRESADCLGFVERQTQRFRQAGMNSALAGEKAFAHLCHTLLNTNEFLYVP
jgi:hypothetical protein